MRLLETQARDARADDLSGDAHRQLIGWIGLLLPALLVAIAIERDGLERWRSLESISAYYYTGAVAGVCQLTELDHSLLQARERMKLLRFRPESRCGDQLLCSL